MKKTLLQIILGLVLVSCASTKTRTASGTSLENDSSIYYDFADRITSEQLQFIKNAYKWNNEELLVINYRQPISDCHYDNNTITPGTVNWWNDFYSEVNADSSLVVHVLNNGERVKEKLDNTNFFDDKDDFLLDNFFYRKKSCAGILVIHQNGDYIQYNGEYNESQVAKFIENLKA